MCHGHLSKIRGGKGESMVFFFLFCLFLNFLWKYVVYESVSEFPICNFPFMLQFLWGFSYSAGGRTFGERVRGQGFSSLWFCRNLCSTETAIQSVHLQRFHTLIYHKILFQWQSILSRDAGETMQENRSTSILNQLFVLVGNTYRLCSLAWTVKTGKIYFVCVSEEK